MLASAIRAARKAFDEGPWPRMSGKERASYLYKISALIKDHVEELALMTSLVRVADRAGANLFDLETFVAREIDSPHGASDAPAAAGGGL